MPGIPRGPDEWGRLLYEDEWGRSRTYRNPYDLFAFALGAFFGVSLIILSFFIYTNSDPIEVVVISFFIGLTAFFLCLIGIGSERSVMPFRVYENGPTIRNIPLKMSMRRDEMIIPRSTIKKVDIEVPFGVDQYLVIEHSDVGVDPITYAVRLRRFDDPRQPLLALRIIVPDKFTEDAKAYLSDIKIK